MERECELNDEVFLPGLALGWLFSSSVLVNNSVRVMSNNFGFEKEQCEEENNVSLTSLLEEKEPILLFLVRSWFF